MRNKSGLAAAESNQRLKMYGQETEGMMLSGQRTPYSLSRMRSSTTLTDLGLRFSLKAPPTQVNLYY